MKKFTLIFLLITIYSYSQDSYNFDQLEADNFFENGEYKRAIELYDKVILNSDNDPYNYYLRGLAKHNVNDNYGAITDLTKSLNLLKTENLEGNWAYQKRTFKTQDGYMNGVGMSFIHKYYHILFYRGYSKYKVEDYRGALQDFLNYLKYDYTEESVFELLAITYYALEDYKNAAKYYEEAIKINPENERSYFFLGVSYLETDELNKGCLNLSKSGELGNLKAYELIKKYCN